ELTLRSAGTVTEALPGAFGSRDKRTRSGSLLLRVPVNGPLGPDCEYTYIESSACIPLPTNTRLASGSGATGAGCEITRTLNCVWALLTPGPGCKLRTVRPTAVQLSGTETLPNPMTSTLVGVVQMPDGFVTG